MLIADMGVRPDTTAAVEEKVQRTADRRQGLRDDVSVPASVVAVESPEFEAQTINASKDGFFLAAAGSFKVVVRVGNTDYRCRLVRAFEMREGVTGCAVQVEEKLQATAADADAEPAAQARDTSNVDAPAASRLVRAWHVLTR